MKDFFYNHIDNIIYIIIILVVLGFSGTMVFKQWTAGSNSDDYKPICINGKLGWRMNFMTKTSMTLDLDSLGHPIRCEDTGYFSK